MARGLGPVEQGVIVIPARGDGVTRDVATGAIDFADVPSGWRVIESAHPFVDERSVIAAKAVREVVDAAGEGDVVLALISGGASALIEEPIDGITIEELAATTREVMESGAPIAELNDVRATLSRVKRGGLVANCMAPVLTFAISDVIGDGLAIIGSGPTIGSWFVDDEESRRERAIEILGHRKLVVLAVARAAQVSRAEAAYRSRAGAALRVVREATPPSIARSSVRVRAEDESEDDYERRLRAHLDIPMYRASAPRDRDLALVVGTMERFSSAAMGALLPAMWIERLHRPLDGDVAACAKRLVELVGVSDAKVHGTYVAWGEPTLRVPEDHGEGGRAQQLALELAKALRGTSLIAMAIGSDGIDGPPPKDRAAPAGAIVDGATWDAILAKGYDPERALERCDAGTVLDAVGALVVTGPTGINHGDLVVIGDRRE
jgi:hydroxypyruvate reductase